MLSKMDYGRYFKVISHWQELPARYQTRNAKLLRLFCSICSHLHISAYHTVSRLLKTFLPGTEMSRLNVLQMVLNIESDNYNYLDDPFNLCRYHMTISVDQRMVADKELLFLSEEKLPAFILADVAQIWKLEYLTTERLYVTIQDKKTCERIKLLFDYKSYEDNILKSLDQEWADHTVAHSGEPLYARDTFQAYSEAV